MSWAAAIGAAGAVASSVISSSGAPAPPKFTPWNVSTGLGTTTAKRGGKGRGASRMTSELSPEQQALADQYGAMAQSYLTGGPNAALAQQLTSQAGGQIPGLFQGALDASATDPYSLAAYQQSLQGLGGNLAGLFGASGQAGLNALGSPAPGAPQANAMFGYGQQLAGNNYQNVFDQRLGLLRQQAQPFEQRAQDSFLNRMYSMGQLGNHTGGLRNTEAFASGLAQADTTRQLDAMNLSEALYGRDQTLAQGYMGQGMQGLIQGFGTQGQVGQGLLGLSSSLGGQLGGLYNSQFGAMQGFNELTNSRAQQRMQNASNMFGFGDSITTQALQTGTGLHASQLNLYNALQAQQEQSRLLGMGNLAQGQAQAAAYQPGALQSAALGFGQAISANPAGFGQSVMNLFGGGTNQMAPYYGSTGSALPAAGAFGITNNAGTYANPNYGFI